MWPQAGQLLPHDNSTVCKGHTKLHGQLLVLTVPLKSIYVLGHHDNELVVWHKRPNKEKVSWITIKILVRFT